MEALKASGEKSVFPSVYAVRRFCMSCRENSSVCIRASDTSVGSNVSVGAPEAAPPGAGVSADAEASGEADGAGVPSDGVWVEQAEANSRQKQSRKSRILRIMSGLQFQG